MVPPRSRIAVVSPTVVVACMAFAVFVRLAAAPQLQGSLLYDTDSYRFLRQAQIIDRDGRLPDVDAERWPPTGRDLTTYLSLSSYAMAFATRVARIVLPAASVYDVAVVFPVVCFSLTLVVAYALAARVGGRVTAAVTVVILATMPTAVSRSVVGYADRDAFTLLLACLALCAFILRLLTASGKRGLAWAAVAGVSLACLGLTWEGAGVYVVVATSGEMALFLSGRYSRRRAHEFGVWASLLLLGLLTLTRAYRTAANPSSPFAVLALAPPLAFGVILMMRSPIRGIRARRGDDDTRGQAELLASALGIGTLGIAVGVAMATSADLRYVAASLAANAASALGQSRLMQAVGELQDTSLARWSAGHGALYGCAAMGACLLVREASSPGWRRAVLTAGVALLSLVALYHRTRDGDAWGIVEPGAYALSMACLTVGGVLSRVGASGSVAAAKVTIVAWYCISLALTRGAVRYDFFLSVPEAILAGQFVVAGWSYVAAWRPRWSHARRVALASAGSVGMLLTVLHGSHAYRLARHMRPLSATPEWTGAFAWMRANLPNDAVVAASWDYGSHLNVRGGVATVIDEDHFVPYWIHLALRHTLFAHSDMEAVEFLHTRGSTHLMLTGDDLLTAAGSSGVASDERLDRKFALRPLHVSSEGDGGALVCRLAGGSAISAPFTFDGRRYGPGEWVIEAFTLQGVAGGDGDANIRAEVSLSLGGTATTLPLRRLYRDREQLLPRPDRLTATFPGAVVIARADADIDWHAMYIPEPGCHALIVRFLTLGEQSPYFTQVYPDPKDVDEGSAVRLYHVEYPGAVASRPEYSATEFPTTEFRDAWMFDMPAAP